jgi:hypothetical protein
MAFGEIVRKSALVGALILRMVFTTMALTMLCGCFDDQKRETAKCTIEATKEYPTDRNYMDRMGFIKLCMTAAGYEFDIPDDRCTGFPLEQNAYCYVPMNWMARDIFNAEVDARAHRPANRLTK